MGSRQRGDRDASRNRPGLALDRRPDRRHDQLRPRDAGEFFLTFALARAIRLTSLYIFTALRDIHRSRVQGRVAGWGHHGPVRGGDLQRVPRRRRARQLRAHARGRRSHRRRGSRRHRIRSPGRVGGCHDQRDEGTRTSQSPSLPSVRVHITKYPNTNQLLTITYVLQALTDYPVRSVRMLGSAAIMLAWVAAGRLTAYFECDLNAWDTAAGALLVREAGGTMTDLVTGEEYNLQTR